MSIPDWPSWNQSSAFEGQSGVDTCHHGIKQKSFWLLFEGEKPATWGGRLAVGGVLGERAEAGRGVGGCDFRGEEGAFQKEAEVNREKVRKTERGGGFS